jgi:hypothetical protein
MRMGYGCIEQRPDGRARCEEVPAVNAIGEIEGRAEERTHHKPELHAYRQPGLLSAIEAPLSRELWPDGRCGKPQGHGQELGHCQERKIAPLMKESTMPRDSSLMSWACCQGPRVIA